MRMVRFVKVYIRLQAQEKLCKGVNRVLSNAVRPASTLKNTVILAATLFSGARVYYALR